MYYGIDSDTAVFPTGASTHNFYAGRLGTGTTGNTSYFNDTGASLASKVYMYWGIKGPKSDPTYVSGPYYTVQQATSWGASQASAAILAWGSKVNVNMYTIFADIEEGFGGWLISSDTSAYINLNYNVFWGFINGIKANPSFKTGIYTSRGSWQNIMGTANSPAYAATVWGANYPTGSTFNNPPASMSGCYSINGTTPTIWQYYGETGTHNPLITGDANIASSLPA